MHGRRFRSSGGGASNSGASRLREGVQMFIQNPQSFDATQVNEFRTFFQRNPLPPHITKQQLSNALAKHQALTQQVSGGGASSSIPMPSRSSSTAMPRVIEPPNSMPGAMQVTIPAGMQPIAKVGMMQPGMGQPQQNGKGVVPHQTVATGDMVLGMHPQGSAVPGVPQQTGSLQQQVANPQQQLDSMHPRSGSMPPESVPTPSASSTAMPTSMRPSTTVHSGQPSQMPGQVPGQISGQMPGQMPGQSGIQQTEQSSMRAQPPGQSVPSQPSHASMQAPSRPQGQGEPSQSCGQNSHPTMPAPSQSPSVIRESKSPANALKRTRTESMGDLESAKRVTTADGAKTSLVSSADGKTVFNPAPRTVLPSEMNTLIKNQKYPPQPFPLQPSLRQLRSSLEPIEAQYRQLRNQAYSQEKPPVKPPSILNDVLNFRDNLYSRADRKTENRCGGFMAPRDPFLFDTSVFRDSRKKLQSGLLLNEKFAEDAATELLCFLAQRVNSVISDMRIVAMHSKRTYLTPADFHEAMYAFHRQNDTKKISPSNIRHPVAMQHRKIDVSLLRNTILSVNFGSANVFGNVLSNSALRNICRPFDEVNTIRGLPKNSNIVRKMLQRIDEPNDTARLIAIIIRDALLLDDEDTLRLTLGSVDHILRRPDAFRYSGAIFVNLIFPMLCNKKNTTPLVQHIFVMFFAKLVHLFGAGFTDPAVSAFLQYVIQAAEERVAVRRTDIIKREQLQKRRDRVREERLKERQQKYKAKSSDEMPSTPSPRSNGATVFTPSGLTPPKTSPETATVRTAVDTSTEQRRERILPWESSFTSELDMTWFQTTGARAESKITAEARKTERSKYEIPDNHPGFASVSNLSNGLSNAQIVTKVATQKHAENYVASDGQVRGAIGGLIMAGFPVEQLVNVPGVDLTEYEHLIRPRMQINDCMDIML